jgi:hypothetical protein
MSVAFLLISNPEEHFTLQESQSKQGTFGAIIAPASPVNPFLIKFLLDLVKV